MAQWYFMNSSNLVLFVSALTGGEIRFLTHNSQEVCVNNLGTPLHELWRGLTYW